MQRVCAGRREWGCESGKERDQGEVRKGVGCRGGRTNVESGSRVVVGEGEQGQVMSRGEEVGRVDRRVKYRRTVVSGAPRTINMKQGRGSRKAWWADRVIWAVRLPGNPATPTGRGMPFTAQHAPQRIGCSCCKLDEGGGSTEIESSFTSPSHL